MTSVKTNFCIIYFYLILSWSLHKCAMHNLNMTTKSPSLFSSYLNCTIVLKHYFSVYNHHKSSVRSFNSSPLEQNGHYFTDDIFKYIFMNEKFRFLINSSLRFAPKDQIKNIPELVQIMAWCWLGDNPLSEPMMVILLMNKCITRPQWGKQQPVIYIFWYWN